MFTNHATYLVFNLITNSKRFWIFNHPRPDKLKAAMFDVFTLDDDLLIYNAIRNPDVNWEELASIGETSALRAFAISQKNKV